MAPNFLELPFKRMQIEIKNFKSSEHYGFPKAETSTHLGLNIVTGLFFFGLSTSKRLVYSDFQQLPSFLQLVLWCELHLHHRKHFQRRKGSIFVVIDKQKCWVHFSHNNTRAPSKSSYLCWIWRKGAEVDIFRGGCHTFSIHKTGTLAHFSQPCLPIPESCLGFFPVFVLLPSTLISAYLIVSSSQKHDWPPC